MIKKQHDTGKKTPRLVDHWNRYQMQKNFRDTDLYCLDKDAKFFCQIAPVTNGTGKTGYSHVKD